MRKFNLWLCGLLLVQGAVSQLQAQYLGTKQPYLPARHVYTPAPAGYAPVFVNYAGRHGARFLTKAGADQEVLAALEPAERSGALTDAGKRIKWAAGLLREAGKGNYEHITQTGKEEQEGLGKRMRDAYKDVFGGRGLEIVTTWKARTQESADAFLRAFSSYRGKKHFSRAADSLDAVLRFYDLSEAYQRYKKGALLKRAMDSLRRDERNRSMAEAVCSRVFRKDYAARLNETGEGLAFAESLYDLYAISFSMKGELRQEGVTSAMAGAFDGRDLDWLDNTNGAADFLEKGPAYDSLGIQVKVAVPLLVDFIRTVDREVDGTAERDAVLRFTHAEAIAPLAALMGIEGASRPSESVFHYRDRWRADAVIPLSANIQWVLYRGGRGKKDWLVKVLLNEKEVRLPLTSRYAGPYYRWEDLRRWYVEKLRGLGAGLQDDALQFLKELHG